MTDSVASLLPHTPPAILLQEMIRKEPGSLTATTILGELGSPWMEAQGMPIAFGMEIIAQTAALVITSQAKEDPNSRKLIGGRLVSSNIFRTEHEYLPKNDKLSVTAQLADSSAIGYFRFNGRIERGDEELLFVEFTVLALYSE
ncbi:hotdog family protein [Puniceicoccus vermicola]|uniref:Uncharacterized protein n=1 Tax=Puniceicoccus vermicola TaxID=388746 RepID=A0A7X1E321_9BACT|nr:hypothetical protein [Puniceicoccus vermicola]MBC2601040.1 hypothetical protein [Puniceicoccus vermicola]